MEPQKFRQDNNRPASQKLTVNLSRATVLLKEAVDFVFPQAR